MKNYTITLSVNSDGRVFGIDITDIETKEEFNIPSWDIEETDITKTSLIEFITDSIKYFEQTKNF